MDLREAIGRYLFERSPHFPGASPEDAPWDQFVERNQEEWRAEADGLIAFFRQELHSIVSEACERTHYQAAP